MKIFNLIFHKIKKLFLCFLKKGKKLNFYGLKRDVKMSICCVEIDRWYTLYYFLFAFFFCKNFFFSKGACDPSDSLTYKQRRVPCNNWFQSSPYACLLKHTHTNSLFVMLLTRDIQYFLRFNCYILLLSCTWIFGACLFFSSFFMVKNGST
jgi:hypothetical protein